MNLCYQIERHKLHVQLSGELDHHSAPMIRDALDKLLENESITQLELDLKRLEFMDSSGIGVVLGRYRTVASRGGSVLVSNVSPQVHRIMQMADLYKVVSKVG